MGLVLRGAARPTGVVFSRRAHLVLAFCGAAYPQIALAQDIDPSRFGDDETVVVEEQNGGATILQRLILGAGQAKVAIDTPQAVTVVEQEDIDREQATMLGDVLKRIPGVSTSGSDRMFGQTFNIRGIGAPEQAGEEGRIIVNVDGANKFYEQYRMGGFFSDPELYKKVEVLRGPASSTLYGSGALGGVINFVTKDASDYLAPGQTGMLKLKGSYNSNPDGYLGSFVFAQRINGNADFLLTGNYRTADNYFTGDGTEIRSSNFDTWSGLAKTTFYLNDEARLRLSYQHWDSSADDQDLAQTGTETTFGTVDRHVVDRTAVISYKNPFSGNDLLDLKISASFSDTTNEQRDPSGNPAFFITCATTQLVCDSDYGYQTWQFNIENTAEARGDNWENFFTYGYQHAHQIRTAEVLEPTAAPNIVFHPEGTDTKHGFFVQNEFIWDEKLTLIPGVRFDIRRLESDPSTGLTNTTDDTAISPKIAAHYRFNENLAVFGSFAHTERFPTIDEVYTTGNGRGTVFDPSYGLKKELSNNIEGGVAVSGYDLFEQGDSMQVKTTAFHNDITDLIDNNTAVSPATNPNAGQPGYINIDNAEIYGVEVELAYDSKYVFANAGYSRMIGRNTDTGEYLTSVAPHELNFTLGGRVPEHDLEFGWRGRFVSDPVESCRVSTASVICPSTGTSASTRYSRAFNVHDIFVSWVPKDSIHEGWEARFGIDNIFDTQYKEFLNNDAAMGRTYKFTLAKAIGW